MQSPTKVVGRRLVAFIIDFLIFAAISVAAWFALTTQVSGKCPTGGGGITIGNNCRGFVIGQNGKQDAWYIICLAAAFVIWVILPGLSGTSPGHAVMGLRIVDVNGQKPGFWRGLGRGFFMWLIDVSIVGLIVAAVTQRNQRVGDLVAGTFVVDKDAVGSALGPVPQPGFAGGGQQFGPPPGQYGPPPVAQPPAYAPPAQPPQPQQQAAQKADWYPDPHGQARLRYWDGQQWTEHTSA
jgi:uncharacterized RDD family membrane protein YckC